MAVARLSIRTLLTAITGGLAGAAIALSLFVLSMAHQDRVEAERLQIANRLGDAVIEAAGLAALERGIVTGNLAARTAPTSNEEKLLEEVRAKLTLARMHIDGLTGALLDRAPSTELRNAREAAVPARAELDDARQRASSSMGSGVQVITSDEWFEIATSGMEREAKLRLAALTPPGGGRTLAFALRANLATKHAIWLASEHAGRERALVSAAIAYGEPIDGPRYDRLVASRAIFETSLSVIFDMEPTAGAEVLASIHAVRHELLGELEEVRKRVYEHREHPGEAPQYPLSREAWVARSTRAIDTLRALSKNLSLEVDARLEGAIRSSRTRELLSAAACLISILLGAASLVTVGRRIVRPVMALHRAADSYGRGELFARVAVSGSDELDRLAQAFNTMAQTLASERQQLRLHIDERDAEIVERKKAEAQLRLLHAALHAAANPIVITDSKGTVSWVNPAFSMLTGYSFEESVGRSLRFLRSGAHDAAFYEDLWKTIASGRQWRGEIKNRRKDGTLYEEEMTITPVPDGEGHITHFVAIKQDITERKDEERRLVHSALHDGLTSLPRRSVLTDRLERALARAQRDPSAQCAVLFVDLDDFKPINDSLGHEVGDHVLVEIAARIRSAVRAADMASRFGGDEFVVLLEDVVNPAVVREVADRISRRIREDIQHGDRSVRVAASMGVALSGASAITAAELIRRADLAMYRAKHQGKGGVVFFDGDRGPDGEFAGRALS